MPIPNPTLVLRQRIGFVNEVARLAELCNWPNEEVGRLREYINDQMIFTDNLFYEVWEETGDFRQGLAFWEYEMEQLRRWLSTNLRIEVKYI